MTFMVIYKHADNNQLDIYNLLQNNNEDNTDLQIWNLKWYQWLFEFKVFKKQSTLSFFVQAQIMQHNVSYRENFQWIDFWLQLVCETFLTFAPGPYLHTRCHEKYMNKLQSLWKPAILYTRKRKLIICLWHRRVNGFPCFNQSINYICYNFIVLEM